MYSIWSKRPKTHTSCTPLMNLTTNNTCKHIHTYKHGRIHTETRTHTHMHKKVVTLYTHPCKNEAYT